MRNKEQAAKIERLNKRIERMEVLARDYGIHFSQSERIYTGYVIPNVTVHYSSEDNPGHAAAQARVEELETGLQTAIELFGLRDKYGRAEDDPTGFWDFTSPTEKINKFLKDLAVVAEELAAEREEAARHKKTDEARTRLGIRTEQEN